MCKLVSGLVDLADPCSKSRIMKHLLLLVLSTVLLSACQKMETAMPQPLPQVMPGFSMVSSTTFSSLNRYNVSGRLEVWKNGNAYEFRFIDFRSTNGPDLEILLTTGQSANPSINLGDIQGIDGNYIYQYTDTNGTVGDFSHVLVWCTRFSVAFGIAPFASE